MDRLRSAVAWSDKDVTLSMFVVSPHAAPPTLDLRSLSGPDRLRTYELDDELGVLRGLHVYEHDVVWKDFPPDLDQLITLCLRSALKQGATVAWFGFEGSFDFDHLLHPDIADQIYAVAVDDGKWLALDDGYRLGDAWRRRLEDVRNRVLP